MEASPGGWTAPKQLSDVVSLQDQMDAAMGSGTLAGYGEIAGSNLGIRSAYGSLVLEGPDGQTSTFSASAFMRSYPRDHGMLMSAHATSAADAWVTIDTCAPPTTSAPAWVSTLAAV